MQFPIGYCPSSSETHFSKGNGINFLWLEGGGEDGMGQRETEAWVSLMDSGDRDEIWLHRWHLSVGDNIFLSFSDFIGSSYRPCLHAVIVLRAQKLPG